MRLLIRNGTLVTLGEPCRVLEGHDLLVEGDRIARIAPAGEIPGPFDREVDARGKVVLPGLVNAHMHFYSTLVRGLGKAAPSANFQEILENLWWRLDRKLSLDDVEVSARVILVEAIRRGTTTLVDHHASPGAVRGSLGRIAKAVKETGLRSCLCYEVSDRDGARVTEQGLEENAAFARECAAASDPQLRALFGLHAAFTLSDETLGKAARMGRDLGVGFHVHVAEAASDVAANRAKHGKSSARRLIDHGILGTGSIAAHAVHCDDADKDALAASGAWVVTNPQSNLNNAVGIADVVGLVRRGVPVGLGTDAMTVAMLEELRVGLFAQHLRQENPTCGFLELTGTLFVQNPRIASTLWGFPIGTLAEGAAADVILVDYLPPTPLNDATALGHLVFGLSQAVVDTTICGGRVLMYGRRLEIGLDEEALAAESRRLATALWERF
ncbi:MAG TPA: putative aminohydrolase SsnA [Thermoanaerobaculia bacterium]|nr:putative aminohydrolase SsnA [Thermoanaerobaculia bacterium]HQN07868.1 putative aminohydrolase SsnA [Thermoanaerobaculia bacterium]HQP88054.1 putative aminohydrolase SsnA [Thermoanaerobaculia bacterium]